MLSSSSSLLSFYRMYSSSFFFCTFSFSFSFFIFYSSFSSLLSGPFCSKCRCRLLSFSYSNFFSSCSFFSSSSLLLSFYSSSVFYLFSRSLVTAFYWMELDEVWMLLAEAGGLFGGAGRLARGARSNGVLPSSIILSCLI